MRVRTSSLIEVMWRLTWDVRTNRAECPWLRMSLGMRIRSRPSLVRCLMISSKMTMIVATTVGAGGHHVGHASSSRTRTRTRSRISIWAIVP